MSIRFLSSILIISACTSSSDHTNIQYHPIDLLEEDRAILLRQLDGMHEKYDPTERMLTKVLNGWNYHTDAEEGTFHEVRSSLRYAVMLADSGVDSLVVRAWDVISATLDLQDQSTGSKSCGVWPYYLEEPLATKKAPIDYNWADFNSVSLLTIWMGHQEQIPHNIKEKIRKALVLAARSIQRRNVGPGYTNIAIMGTYVTYMVAHLFDLPDMQVYADQRLQAFHAYTLEKGGFREYNSPTYNMVALEELMRMKNHMIEPSVNQMLDSLYTIGWDMIARHFHQPTLQWAGPQSRAYSSFVRPRFYTMLNGASEGSINIEKAEERYDGAIKHDIPKHLLPYFVDPIYPRTEVDIFEKEDPRIIGTCHLTELYALATVSRSSMWNQRRPFLVHWGDEENPKYLQLRFLHDGYDFSSATFFSEQQENRVLAGINFVLDGGDKHISIDRLNNGRFEAEDLRLRFEFGGVGLESLHKPGAETIYFSDGVGFTMGDFQARFSDHQGYWQVDGSDDVSWIDYIIYSGEEHSFELSEIEEAVIFFAFFIQGGVSQADNPILVEDDRDQIRIAWEGMELELAKRPYERPVNL